jgi:hypothetical protein
MKCMCVDEMMKKLSALAARASRGAGGIGRGVRCG